MNYKNLILTTTLFILYLKINAQEIVWANRLLEFTDKFQFDNNKAEMLLGVTKVYPGNAEDKNVDAYSEGYILYYENTIKKNIIRVGFNNPVLSKQVLMGGVFNIGSIYSISITDDAGLEKEIFKPDTRASKTKFNTFSTFFSARKVKEVKIVIDHSNISNWNLIKGVGLSNSDQPIDLRPVIVSQEGFANKQKFAENISSKDCFEFSPKVSPDGKTIYFVKQCQNQSDQDIWISQINEKGEWGEAKNAGFPLNNKGHNFVASISVDGRFLILGNTYNNDGSEAGDGVSISYKKDDGSFEIPKPIKIPNFKNTNQHANFFMSTDENVLLMAIQDEKSIGNLDIYASLYNRFNQTWSEPINLGNQINTPFFEDYPYLAADGKTLYFSSDGYMGYGGYDIFMSKRLDDTWKNWSKPINLGPLVNSKGDDKGFSLAARGDKAFFNGVNFEVDSAHHMDIYKIDLPKILKQNPQILLTGTISNSVTKKPVRATLRIKDEKGDLLAYCNSNERNGKYAISLTFGKQYKTRIDAINYYKKEGSITLFDSLAGNEVLKNFEIDAFLDSGQFITVSNILFKKGSSEIDSSSSTVLDSLTEILKQQIDAKIEIGGHTDNIGEIVNSSKVVKAKENNKKSNVKTKLPDAPKLDNVQLSLERAKSVSKYLVQKGIGENRIVCKGYGASQPIADNSTEAGRLKNRRVVITFISSIPK